MENKENELHLLISYENKKEIGQEGLNSRTFLAFDKNLKRDIVIKELNEVENWSLDDYYKEARILNEFKHPNVVEIILAGEQIIYNNGLQRVNKICLAMPYYKNGSLKDLLKKSNLDDKIKSSLILNILHGLSSIHAKRLIHLDLKPDNILISDRNEALISDFGISQYLKEDKSFLKWTSQMKIHPLLAPPEILYDEQYISRKTDIYQIGILIYLIYTEQTLEQFTKVINFTEEELNNYFCRVKKGILFIDDNKIPDKVKKIIKKCLHLDHSKRYSSVIEINNAFNSI